MPMYMLKGRATISNTISNVLVGMSSFAVSCISIPRRFLLTSNQVPIYDPSVLPSRPARLSVKGRTSPLNSIAVNTSRRAHCRLRYVAMGNAQPSRPTGLFPHDPRKCSDCIAGIPRFELETCGVSLPCEPRAGDRVPEYFIYEHCGF